MRSRAEEENSRAPDIHHLPALHKLRLTHYQRGDHRFAFLALQLVDEHRELLVTASPSVQLVHWTDAASRVLI